MSSNLADAHALARGMEHFGFVPTFVSRLGSHVALVTMSRLERFDDDAEILADLLDAAYHLFSDMDTATVHLCTTPNIPDIPTYVRPALERLAGSGIGLFLSLNELNVHDGTLKGDFVEPMKAAMRDGYIWHSTAGRLVLAVFG